MLEVSLSVERGSQVSVVSPDPVCCRGACTPRPGDLQTDWLFQCRSLPRGRPYISAKLKYLLYSKQPLSVEYQD
jgi:hypothetical protein